MAAGGSFFIVEVDAAPLDQLITDLAKTDLTPAMAIIAEDFVAAVNDMFDTSGHGEWPPLAASTIAKRRGNSSKPMEDTGRLAGSISAVHGPDFAEATTNVDYVKYHLEGGDIIPRRNPFDVDDDVYDEAIQTIFAFLLDE